MKKTAQTISITTPIKTYALQHQIDSNLATGEAFRGQELAGDPRNRPHINEKIYGAFEENLSSQNISDRFSCRFGSDPVNFAPPSKSIERQELVGFLEDYKRNIENWARGHRVTREPGTF